MKYKNRTLNTKIVLLAGIVICGIGISSLIYFFASQAPVPHRNLADLKISQYSDKNITQNAISIDSEFKNITFETPARQSLFSSHMAAAIRAVKRLAQTSLNQERPREYGSWVWTPVMTMSPEYVESLLSGAKANGVNTIYISIDTYLDIFVLPKSPEREVLKYVFSEKLEDFIERANAKGIAVDAEAGWRNWAEDGNTYKALAVVNFVKNFNASHENKLRGFQYDIEPYLLDSYENDKTSVLRNFVELVDKTEYFIGTSSIQFSVVVPDFYDGKDEMTPKFTYNGQKDYVFKHLLNILDRRDNSSIIIMSYRGFANGYDGTIEISENEMQTAKNGRHGTKIIIAQETGDVPPPYITFYNTSKKYLARQIESIDTSFGSYPNFGGIAVHYVNAFLALK